MVLVLKEIVIPVSITVGENIKKQKDFLCVNFHFFSLSMQAFAYVIMC